MIVLLVIGALHVCQFQAQINRVRCKDAILIGAQTKCGDYWHVLGRIGYQPGSSCSETYFNKEIIDYHVTVTSQPQDLCWSRMDKIC